MKRAVASAQASARIPLQTVQRDPRRWGALAACCIVAFSELVEPRLHHMGLRIPHDAFGASFHQFQILNSFTIILFMTSMLLGGFLGDLLGRHRVFLFGAVGYVVGNVLVASAMSIEWFIAARIFVAICGGMVLPLTLATIRTIFDDREERIIAIVLYTITTSAASLLALLAILIEANFGWRATLIPPIVAGTLGTALAWNYLPFSKALGGFRRADALAAAVWSLLFLGLMYGLLLAQFIVHGGVRFVLIIGILIGLVAISFGVARWQQRSARESENVYQVPVYALTMLLFISAALSFALINYPLRLYNYFLVVRELGFVLSGFALLPFLITMLSLVRPTVTLTERYSMPLLIAGGMGLMATGMLLTAGAGTTTPYILMIAPMVIFTFGYLIASSAWSNAFLNVIPKDLVGINVGMSRAAGAAGSTIGGLLLSAILISVGQRTLEQRALAQGLSPDRLNEAMLALNAVLQREEPMLPVELETIPPKLISAVLMSNYREAYMSGLAAGWMLVGVIYFAIVLVIWFGLRWVAAHEPTAATVIRTQPLTPPAAASVPPPADSTA